MVEALLAHLEDYLILGEIQLLLSKHQDWEAMREWLETQKVDQQCIRNRS